MLGYVPFEFKYLGFAATKFLCHDNFNSSSISRLCSEAMATAMTIVMSRALQCKLKEEYGGQALTGRVLQLYTITDQSMHTYKLNITGHKY